MWRRKNIKIEVNGMAIQNRNVKDVEIWSGVSVPASITYSDGRPVYETKAGEDYIAEINGRPVTIVASNDGTLKPVHNIGFYRMGGV